MPTVELNRFYKYEELSALLAAFAAEHPDLVQVESIGKSYEGRGIWLVTVTNLATGPASEKPAFFCDGNIHAVELSGSAAVLAVLQKLVAERPALLDTRALYLVPRLNPDGAEWAMEDVPRVIRSSTRPYPYDEEDCYGLERKDLDGDGRILNVRVEDPNGPWKVCEQEPRLMVKRGPGETGATYYRLLPEGLLHNWDGMQLRDRRQKEGLDLNRNYPSAWRLEHEQHGAGLSPAGEPEIHAEVDAICKRPNICGAISFHTSGGLILRQPGRCPDAEMEPEDLWNYKELSQKGTDLSGYPAIGLYEDFRYHPKEVLSGDFDDWMYQHRGVYAWTVEIWSAQRQAGITDYKYIDWWRVHPVDDDLKMLKWSDEKLGGRGYVDWKPFEHPQLGKCEIGGWDDLHAFTNPPSEYLEAELKPLADWVVWLAAATPCLAERELRVERQGDATRIRFAVQNTGWLPTNVAKTGTAHKLCRGVVGEIARQGDAPGGAGRPGPDWLVSGLLRHEAGQLAGWDRKPSAPYGWHTDDTSDVAVFEWVVRGKGTYELTARHERAGVVRRTVTVE